MNENNMRNTTNKSKNLISSAQLSNFLLSLLMWTWGGTVYFFMEVIYKTLTNHPEHISWTMIIVAFILCIPLERLGAELPWEMPMVLQTLISAIGITITELISGIIINIWLGLNVWDYSHLRFNFMGQICLQFFFVWIALSYFGIKIFDWMRFTILGGIRPCYKNFKENKINNKKIYCRNHEGRLVELRTDQFKD